MTSRPTLADPAGEAPYHPRIIPACERYALLAGGEACGYRDLAQWREVLKADAELALCRATEPEVASAIASFEAEVSALRVAVDHERQALAIAMADRDRLRAELVAKDKDLQDERLKPRIGGSRVPWAIAAGLAIALGTTATVAALQ